MSVGDEQLARLNDVLANLCVSAWLAHGDPLCLGFGMDVSPTPRPAPGWRSPYGLKTTFAAWRIEGPISAEWTDEAKGAEAHALLVAAAESLIGERVVHWEVPADRRSLCLDFTGAKKLTIEAWPVEDGIAEAWSLRAPDRQILAVANDGRCVVVPAALPIADWFPDTLQKSGPR